MHSEAPPVSAGSIVIDAGGIILAADAVFEQAMRSDAPLVGTDAVALTAPADRDRCVALVAQICRDGMPVTTIKRMIRGDGTHIWLRNRLTVAADAPDVRIAVELVECAPPPGWIEPRHLLGVARLVLASRRARETSFGAQLFHDPAWDMLLVAYICEAEGTVATIARTHARTEIPLATASRWIRALSAKGLLEYEGGGNHQLVTTPFRLTSSAHGKFEEYLSDIYRNRAAASQLALRS